MRLWSSPLSDGHRRGSGFGVLKTLLAVAGPLAQVVEMGYRDVCQPLIFLLAVLLVFTLQDALGGWPTQSLMGFIHPDQ